MDETSSGLRSARPPFAWLVVGLLAWTCPGLGAHAGAQAPVEEVESQGAQFEGVVNLNTASEEQLAKLPGVGPSKARAIIEARERFGGFRHVRQIVRVRGIGRATFRKLRPMLTVDGETTLE